MGCRHYFVTDRLEELVDEGDLSIFFTSSRTRKFSACFTTACGNPDTLKSMFISSRCVNNSDCSLPTGRTVLTRSASTFSSASLSLSIRSTDKLVLSQPSKKRVSISWALERDVCSVITGRLFWQLDMGLIGLVGSFPLVQQLLNPILSSNYL